MKPRMPRIELPDPYKVQIVLDSVAPCGVRLTTFALTYPRFVHAELMTHRIFSRNSASSRAIPSEKMRALVKDHPALPVWWGQNQSGMQARSELSDEQSIVTKTNEFLDPIELASPKAEAQRLWREARDVMIEYSDRLAKIGLHKQLCNRLTEVWMPITVLVSSTSYANWFHLRDHKDAQPEIQVVATEMHYQYLESTPQRLDAGSWHMPYIHDEDREWATIRAMEDGPDVHQHQTFTEHTEHYLKKVSVGRCARVSYLSHEGKRELEKDIELHDKLASTAKSEDPGHFSPFEHVAQALGRREQIGNFTGWRQYRKDFATEAGPQERIY